MEEGTQQGGIDSLTLFKRKAITPGEGNRNSEGHTVKQCWQGRGKDADFFSQGTDWAGELPFIAVRMKLGKP